MSAALERIRVCAPLTGAQARLNGRVLHGCCRETAESVRHLGHASEAAHHLVEQLAQGRPRRFRQVRVYRRRGDILVAEKRLDDAGGHLLLEEP